MRALAAIAALATVACATACDHGSTPTPAPATSASSAEPADARAEPPSVASALEAARRFQHLPPGIGCRVIAATGGPSARDEDGGTSPLRVGLFAPRGAWLELDPGATLTVKAPATGRETTFDGPGRVRACVELDEQWIAWGSLAGTPGSGESPGSDQWVLTPAGVVRYVGGANRATVSKDGAKLDVRVATGEVLVWAADGATLSVRANDLDGGASDAGAERARDGGAAGTEEGWARVLNGTTLTVTAKDPAGTKALESSVSRCERSATAAAELAKQILASKDKLGELTERHMVARRTARASCGVATIRLGLRRDAGASVAPWTERLARATHLWRTLETLPR